MIDLVSTLILVAGFVDDLRSRKIHNALLLGLLFLSAIIKFAFGGFTGLEWAFAWMGLGLVLSGPLWMTGVIGGGDVKLFAVFAFSSDSKTVFAVYLFSIMFGALIGSVSASLGGEFRELLRHTVALATGKQAAKVTHFHIPYSAAMLLGWLSYWSVGLWGGFH